MQILQVQTDYVKLETIKYLVMLDDDDITDGFVSKTPLNSDFRRLGVEAGNVMKIISAEVTRTRIEKIKVVLIHDWEKHAEGITNSTISPATNQQ